MCEISILYTTIYFYIFQNLFCQVSLHQMHLTDKGDTNITLSYSHGSNLQQSRIYLTQNKLHVL